MKYQHILTAFAAEPWALQPEKMRAVIEFLAFKAAGGDFTSEELAARMTKKADAEVARAEGAVAVIPVYGVLAQRMNLMSEFSGGTSYQLLEGSLNAALASDEIKAVVLDIDSPGGGVPGAMELGTAIRAVRGGQKPIVAQVNSLAASAAYWIASQADEIVVTPSGRAGSIGVYTYHDDLSGMFEKQGVNRTYISAGEHKVDGNETAPIKGDALNFVQKLVDESYANFVDAVAEGRGVTRATVLDRFGQGRVFGAAELVERGMADRIGTFSETLERFGAFTTPEPVRKIKASNQARAQAAGVLVEKLRAGVQPTERELEHGLKGLAGLSNSEAERATRLLLKGGQGEPDEEKEDAALIAQIASIRRLAAEI